MDDLKKRADSPDDLYGPLIGCLRFTLRKWLLFPILPLSLVFIAVWSLVFGGWTLAAICTIILVYHLYALRTGRFQRDANEPWLERARRGVTEVPAAGLIVGAIFLAVVGAGYGLTIGFWIGLAFWLLMVGFWSVRRLRRSPADGG